MRFNSSNFRWLTVSILILPILAFLILTECVNAQHGHESNGEAGKWMSVSVVGTNYCVGCAHKKEFGAASQCKTYGCDFAFKVEKLVEPCGMELAEWSGKTLYYLENDNSSKLSTDHHGEKLTISGKLYLESSLLEVASFEASKCTKDGINQFQSAGEILFLPIFS